MFVTLMSVLSSLFLLFSDAGQPISEDHGARASGWQIRRDSIQIPQAETLFSYILAISVL